MFHPYKKNEEYIRQKNREKSLRHYYKKKAQIKGTTNKQQPELNIVESFDKSNKKIDHSKEIENNQENNSFRFEANRPIEIENEPNAEYDVSKNFQAEKYVQINNKSVEPDEILLNKEEMAEGTMVDGSSTSARKALDKDRIELLRSKLFY